MNKPTLLATVYAEFGLTAYEAISSSSLRARQSHAPEYHGKRCVICGKVITETFWACRKCEADHGLVGVPYKAWPLWIKRLQKVDRRSYTYRDRWDGNIVSLDSVGLDQDTAQDEYERTADQYTAIVNVGEYVAFRESYQDAKIDYSAQDQDRRDFARKQKVYVRPRDAYWLKVTTGSGTVVYPPGAPESASGLLKRESAWGSEILELWAPYESEWANEQYRESSHVERKELIKLIGADRPDGRTIPAMFPAALARLTAKQRRAVDLALTGLKQHEISAEMGSTQSSVSRLLKGAEKRFAQFRQDETEREI